MAKRQMDDEANLKRQARRRLIGAVVMVTAVVVILPMVLDSEPRLGGQDIDLRIPDPNKVGEFKPGIAPLADSTPAAASEPVATSAVASPPAVAAVPAPQPLVENRPQPESKPQAETKQQPVADKSEKTPAAAKPAAKPQSKPAEKTHAVPKQGFVVQVGAFSNAETAKQWQEKLRKQGLHAYTEKMGSNVRVRIGPYSTRAAAEKVLRRLEAQGMHPVVNSLS